MKPLYLAGPMTGIPQANFPLFDRAAAELRDAGFTIISPAELDDPEERRRALADEPATQTWGEFLARDVKLIAEECDGIIFLPRWWESRGARLEAFVALLSGKDLFFAYYIDDATGDSVRWIPAAVVRQILRENMP